jgi:hypothetical protein
MRDANDDDLLACEDFSDEPPLPPPPEKPKKSSESASQPNPRRRPPARPSPLSLDALLDGITIPENEIIPPSPTSPSPSSPTPTPPPTVTSSNIPFHKDSSLSRLEHSIEIYLSNKFRSLRDEFLSKFEEFLIETDCIDSELNHFLVNLKSLLRKSFILDPPHSDHRNRIIPVIDSTLLTFEKPLQSAIRHRPHRETSQIDELNQQQFSINSFTTILKKSFRTTFDDLTKRCSELQQMETKEKKMVSRFDLQNQGLIEQIDFLECERIRQEIESQTESKLRKTIEEFRKIFANEDDPFVTDEIRSAIMGLRKTKELSFERYLERFGMIRRHLHDDIDEAVSLRDLVGFSHQKFMNAVLIIQGQPRYRSEINDSSMCQFVDSVKHRLREIQARREADLQNSASFLKDVLKEERRRIRSEVSAH